MNTTGPSPKRLDISLEELSQLVDGALHQPLDEAGYRKLKAAVETLSYLTELVSDKATTLNRLRQLLGIEFGSTEKTAAVLAAVAAEWTRLMEMCRRRAMDQMVTTKARASTPAMGVGQQANMRAPSGSP